jgi:hypothetical protein
LEALVHAKVELFMTNRSTAVAANIVTEPSALYATNAARHCAPSEKDSAVRLGNGP